MGTFYNLKYEALELNFSMLVLRGGVLKWIAFYSRNLINIKCNFYMNTALLRKKCRERS